MTFETTGTSPVARNKRDIELQLSATNGLALDEQMAWALREFEQSGELVATAHPHGEQQRRNILQWFASSALAG